VLREAQHGREKEKIMNKHDIIERILKVAIAGNDNFKAGDAERCNYCTAVAVGMTRMLDIIGIEGECGTWQDGDFHRIGLIRIDNVDIIKNSEILFRQYGDAVIKDWSRKVISVTYTEREGR